MNDIELTVGPPPLELSLEVVRRDILGGRWMPEQTWAVPSRGRVEIQLRPTTSAQGSIVHHLWIRTTRPEGAWRRLTQSEGLPMTERAVFELEAHELLELWAVEGILRIFSGPKGQPVFDPEAEPMPGFRMTEVRLVRPSTEAIEP